MAVLTRYTVLGRKNEVETARRNDMRLTSEQLDMLRKPFERVGAFEGRSEEDVKRILENVADIYTTLLRISLKKQNARLEAGTQPQENYGS